MSSASTSQALSPWHDGELRMQRSIDAIDQMDAVGRRAVRDHLTEQHRLFYPQLPFVVLGAVERLVFDTAESDVWATLRAGRPGFLTSPDPLHLRIALESDYTDPAESGMRDGDSIGLLGIELHTRRRNRLNGTILRSDPGEFTIAVEESFGNCPRYIHLRDFEFTREPGEPSPVLPIKLDRLVGAACDLVRRADTFFVASYMTDDNGRRRVDVSHRGGPPGFVRLDADGSLTVPDFNGNRFFNTLGNFLVNPRAGLAFVDFETGNLLQMTGDVEVVLDSPEIAAFEGAERLWRFHPRRVLSRPRALPLRWRPSAR